MLKLSFPNYEFRLKKIDEKRFIFDEIRKKYFELTPEEWVRQNFIKYILSKNYPKSLINCEKVFYINNIQKRYDIVVYNSSGGTDILVECKSPKIKICNKHLDQVMRYNLELQSKNIIITNGLDHFYFYYDTSNKKYLQQKNLSIYTK